MLLSRDLVEENDPHTRRQKNWQCIVRKSPSNTSMAPLGQSHGLQLPGKTPTTPASCPLCSWLECMPLFLIRTHICPGHLFVGARQSSASRISLPRSQTFDLRNNTLPGWHAWTRFFLSRALGASDWLVHAVSGNIGARIFCGLSQPALEEVARSLA